MKQTLVDCCNQGTWCIFGQLVLAFRQMQVNLTELTLPTPSLNTLWLKDAQEPLSLTWEARWSLRLFGLWG